tara:strand:- start:1073 stop:1330 length:258 start_codon:yes stop_codon:yes gene_type:complete
LINESWFDEVVNGEPAKAELWQVSYIDSLLPYTSISISEQTQIQKSLPEMTEIEAEEIIQFINDNRIYVDPQEQYKQMRKAGVFK